LALGAVFLSLMTLSVWDLFILQSTTAAPMEMCNCSKKVLSRPPLERKYSDRTSCNFNWIPLD